MVAGAEDAARALKCLLSCYYLKVLQNPFSSSVASNSKSLISR